MTDLLSPILSDLRRPVALFTDFDGVLVEIAPTPDAISVPDDLPGRLEALNTALGGAFAIITGRPIAEIDAFLALSRPLAISGSHGAETRRNGTLEPPNPALAATAHAIATRAQAALADTPGILIEAKPAGAAIHYRGAPEMRAQARAALEAAIADTPDFHIVSGKMVFEARRKGTDKGRAIAQWMNHPPFAGRVPVFIGDDVTDEDGFRAVQAMNGIGIKLGTGETQARFRLPDIATGYALFDAIARNTMHEATDQ